MKFSKWLTTKKITTPQFAKMIGYSTHAISKWRQRKRIPRPEAMKLIFKLTKGKVSIKDWYPKWD